MQFLKFEFFFKFEFEMIKPLIKNRKIIFFSNLPIFKKYTKKYYLFYRIKIDQIPYGNY